MRQESFVGGLPSGYHESSSSSEAVQVGKEVLPWLDKNDYNLHISRVTLDSGETFLLASAIDSHPKLVEAAESMTDSQSRNCNNMFYSRLPEIAINGFSGVVHQFDKPATSFPIQVMGNPNGQRVYFGRVALGISEEDVFGPTFVKLAVCDKNKQAMVMKVLSGLKGNASSRRISRGMN